MTTLQTVFYSNNNNNNNNDNSNTAHPLVITDHNVLHGKCRPLASSFSRWTQTTKFSFSSNSLSRKALRSIA